MMKSLRWLRCLALPAHRSPLVWLVVVALSAVPITLSETKAATSSNLLAQESTNPSVSMIVPAGEAMKFVIATDATWPPMEFVNEQKKIVGFDIDLMNAAAKEGGFTVVFKNTAWDGIFAGLEAGKYDAVMSSVTITEERKKTMDFSDTATWMYHTDHPLHKSTNYRQMRLLFAYDLFPESNQSVP